MLRRDWEIGGNTRILGNWKGGAAFRSLLLVGRSGRQGAKNNAVWDKGREYCVTRRTAGRKEPLAWSRDEMGYVGTHHKQEESDDHGPHAPVLLS